MNAMHGSNASTSIDASALGRSGYLKRRNAREQEVGLKRQATLGILGGALLILIPGARFLVNSAADDGLMKLLMGLGAILLGLGLFMPSLLAPLEKLVFKITPLIGKVIMNVLLGIIYFVAILPVGWLITTFKGDRPFYRWGFEKNSSRSEDLEGWFDKESNADKRVVANNSGAKNLLLQPFSILSYFISHGLWIFVPVLLILLILGLLLFFAQGSALAPFIYTLF